MSDSCLLCPSLQPRFDQPEELLWPMLGSVKYDGVRALVMPDGRVLTRALKPHKNVNLPAHLAPLLRMANEYGMVLDMELYDESLKWFSDHMAVLGAHTKNIPSTFIPRVFDAIPINEWETKRFHMPYASRFDALETACELRGLTDFLVYQYLVKSPDDASLALSEFLSQGHEGLILRSLSAPYKRGRATFNERIIYKLKPFDRVDAVILDVLPRRAMTEDARTTNRQVGPNGLLERVYTKDSYVEVPMIGSLLVRPEDSNETSEVCFGKGFSLSDRAKLWELRAELIGKWVELEHLSIGAKTKLRHGRVVRFREDKS